MFNRDTWKEIFNSIGKNKLRTFLTGFSVAWAIFILVFLLASVNGMQNGFLKQFSDDATNSIFIYPATTTKPYGGYEAGRRIELDNDDMTFIKRNFEGYYEYISPRVFQSVSARFGPETGSYQMQGVSPDHMYIERTQIDKGRYINAGDIRNKSKVVVIGKVIVNELFKDEDPLGQQIELNGLIFRIVGVFSDDGNEREENRFYAPYTTMQRLYGNNDNIRQIAMTYDPSFTLAEAINFSNNLEEILKRRLIISPEDQGAIYFNNNAEAFSDISEFSGFLKIVAIGVVILILIAGIVAIGNIMVFTVKERTKEIGVRKAMGARPKDIISLILIEAVFITGLSGILGMSVAMALLALIGPSFDMPAFSNPSVDNITVLICTAILILAGVIAGLIPSVKAARIRPIEALRAD